MNRFELKTGAQCVRLNVSECELIGLYAANPNLKRIPQERGLSTFRRDEGKTLILMMETARDNATTMPGALQLLQDLLRDKVKDFTMGDARRMWTEAQGMVGKNATSQLAHVIEARSRIVLKPLVDAWGGRDAAEETQSRNVNRMHRMIPEGMTVDQLTPRFIDGYLQGLLQEKTKWSGGKKTQKRTVLKHRSTINLFCDWLMSPTAANVVFGIGHDDRHVLKSNPVDLVRDEKITQKDGDKKRWNKGRVWYTQDEAHAIVETTDGETRAMLALKFGSMVEFGGLYNTTAKKGRIGPCLFKRDFLRDEKGQFTRWFTVEGLVNRGDPNAPSLEKAETRPRDLEVPDAEGFDWYWRIVEAHLKTLKEDDPFLSRSPKYYKLRFDRALASLGIERPRGRGLFHSCRHTFAAFWVPLALQHGRPDGRDLAWAKNQAGHEEDSVLLLTTYAPSVRPQAKGVRGGDEVMSRKRRGLLTLVRESA